MSSLAKLVRDLQAKGVEGEILAEVIERFDEARAADREIERAASLEAMIELVSRKVDERLPPYDPVEHRRALGRARQAKLEEKKRQNASEDRQDASGCVRPDDKETSPTPPKENNPIPPLKGGTFPQISDDQPREKPKPAVREKALSDWVSEIWEITPRSGRTRSGRAALETALRAAQRRGADLAAMKRGLEAYYASPDATKDGGQYAKGVHVAISSGRWEAFAEDAPPRRTADDDPWPGRLVQWRVAQYWNSDWGPKPGKPGYQGPAQEIAA